MSDQTVQVLVPRTLNSQIAAADIVDGLIIDHETAVGMFQSSVGCENGVVWLHNGSGILGSGVNAEFELALLRVINGQTLHQQGTETRSGTATEGVEDQEPLESAAVVSNTSDFVENLIDHLLSNGVVATGIVVRGIFLSGDHLLWVEKIAVWPSANLIDNVGFQVTVDCPGNIFSLAFRGGQQKIP